MGAIQRCTGSALLRHPDARRCLRGWRPQRSAPSPLRTRGGLAAEAGGVGARQEIQAGGKGKDCLALVVW